MNSGTETPTALPTPQQSCGPNGSANRLVSLLIVIAAASAVYVIAHWSALTNPYVINDDVRQQIYWMQQWNDPELFRDDLLARYARNYNSWGVVALYHLVSPFMNPVHFTKVVAGILYVLSAAFLFGLSLRFRNTIASIAIVCCFFFFTTFLRKVSGGLAQSFGFPLLLAYLFFLSRENLIAAAMIVFLESFLNPYIFLVCLTTHALYLAWNYGPAVVRELMGHRSTAKESPGSIGPTLRRLIMTNFPVMAGVALMAVRYVFFKDAEFGNLVTWSSMAGKVEYTAAGRYEIVPVPSLLHDLLSPWAYFFPVEEWGTPWAWLIAIPFVALGIAALVKWNRNVDLRGFGVFAYLVPASLILYGISYAMLMRLFLPERYIEFSFTVLYAVILGIAVTVVLESLQLPRKKLFVILGICVVLAGARNWHIGIYDYSSDAPLYAFLATTPKNSIMAGPPDLMDNVQTFARRKALVTYELSHTWLDKYWDIIKARTHDLFRAYYATDPEEIRTFARSYGVRYLIVRDKDFSPQRLTKGGIYFEPFDGYIRTLTNSKERFAALDDTEFPVVYQGNGIRVLQIGRDR